MRAWTRRELLTAAGGAALASAGAASGDDAPCLPTYGKVVGHPEAATAGESMLADGGNVVDALVTAALVACVVSIHNCGIGGYGGHMTLATADGRTVSSIDFNSTAPAASRPDMFPLDEKGRVREQLNVHGWLAAGVPGTLAGLQLALQRHGTRSLTEVLQPAIQYAREGFQVPAALATVFKNQRATMGKDPALAKLLLVDGQPPAAGTLLRNPELAAVLQTLADRGTVDSFYTGDLAARIAEAFQKHGGLVTRQDLARYRAHEVAPLRFEWSGFEIRTAPLTAGGITVLEALVILKALRWEMLPAGEPSTLQTVVETLRLAWADRLRILGDPETRPIDFARLLSADHAREAAARVAEAVRERKPIDACGDGRPAGGTVNLCAVDREGSVAALTLTHGSAFGAQVAVEGLGLILGHGMSRFDPHPGHPNAPGPGRRPLNNMCPTVVLRDGRPVVAVGAAGGRKIVNSVLGFLSEYAGRGATLEAALAAPRVHTEGDLALAVGKDIPDAHQAYLREMGYQLGGAAAANLSAVEAPLPETQ
jgi:gamma-glutamyltranspeptidase/glutathione hydrolase